MTEREFPASDSRPMPTSWVRISEPFASHLQNFEEDEVNVTFPTDQVPQPVTRDTITTTTTTMAASTDSRGSACAPTVQDEDEGDDVESTVAGCDSTATTTKNRHNHHNNVDVDVDQDQDRNQDQNVMNETETRRGAQAGLSVNPSPSLGSGNDRCVQSVIASLSCPQNTVSGGSMKMMTTAVTNITAPATTINANAAATTTTTTMITGNSNNLKSNYNNKMQSVNVISTKKTTTTTTVKGNNDNCLLFDNDDDTECNTAVTVPNTKPQRNTIDGSGAPLRTGAAAPNNNSVKLFVINNKDTNNNSNNNKNNGALNRSSTEQPQQSQCRLNQIPGRDIPTTDTDATTQKSDYLNGGDANTITTTATDNNDTTTTMYNDRKYMTKPNNDYNDDYVTLERLIALTKRTKLMLNGGWIPPRRLGLYGGGESSLSTGTTGWGTPPSANANNNNGWGNTSSNNQANANNQPNWNNNPNRTNTSNQGGAPGGVNQDTGANTTSKPNNANLQQQQQSNAVQSSVSQQQANNPGGWGPPSSQNKNQQSIAGPPTNPAGVPGVGVPGVGVPGVGVPGAGQSGAPNASTKQQLEQLNNMREALLAQDGWGGQHVNQDTNWDIPSSPEPQNKMDGSGGPPQWKPTVNNGTDLWEANLRNGGQPPPQPAQKTPWGHTPSTNIGGTWGEDDDVTDSSNVWTGVPNNQQQQWSGTNTNGGGGGGGDGRPMWGGGGPKKESDWPNSGWADPRSGDPRSAAAAAAGLDPRDMRNMDPRDIRSGGSDPIRMLDPRDQMRIVNTEMRGDPRGITGRLNGAGAADAMWAQQQQAPHHLHHQQGKMVGPVSNTPGVNQWAGPPPKDITMGKPTGWEEPSPPSQRRNMPNFDDGTSLWGNPAQQGRVAAASSGNLSHWKELPTGPSGVGMNRGGAAMGCPPGMAPNRMKPDGSVWSSRNGSWEEGGGGSGAGGGHTTWDEPNKWAADGNQSWNKNKSPLWETDMDWGHKQGPKQLTKEMIWSSKQFRILVEMGYKKEDAENALRMREMNLEDALEFLTIQRNSIEGWRTRHEEHFDHQNTGPFPGQRFGPTGPSAQMPFPPQSGNPSILNSMNSVNAASNNPPLASINNISPAIVHKMLNQSASTPSFGNTAAAAAANRSMQHQSQPSTQQLRMLVQQIQMAVQAGYLNHQILNQPLAPQTLILLNQLLQQIKTLQQLVTQQQMAQNSSIGKPNSQVVLQYSVLITKTKQQIQNLQNQIAAQQAIYVKQQHVGGGGGSSATPADFFKTNMHDTINVLPSNFGDLSISKDPQSYQNQQSRLNQWKLPSLDKDSEVASEFSRAPGSVTKPLVPSHSSPNLNPLGLGQSDGPWSSGRSGDTGGWPDAGSGDSCPPEINKEPQWPAPVQPSLTDLVPEFEPGKPWKGNQIKSIEDDPSITPGSVVRSPLSIPTIKDSEIFNTSTIPSKASPPGVSVSDTIQPLSLSSSTWSFNPPTTTPSAFTRIDDPLSKIASSKGTWSDNAPPPTAVTSELWGAPMAKSRGPPPGLAKGASNISLAAANGWAGRGASSWGSQSGSGNWGSPWLLLRNLTAQIDGSTLRTLCMQHGPLQSFHLYLHQGFALVKYSSREEATKAQATLNNCVLGNTTILAESPSESDVNNLLQQLAPQQSASTGAWRGSTKPSTADTWNTGWATNPASGSLWGSAPMDSSDPARATPSSLNSFLPGDLLGGESM